MNEKIYFAYKNGKEIYLIQIKLFTLKKRHDINSLSLIIKEGEI